MAAELVGGAWLGAVVSEILRAVITEVKLASQHTKLFKGLLETLEKVDFFLNELNCSIDTNESVQRWLEDLRVRLNEAKYLTTEYQNASGPGRLFIMPRKIQKVQIQMKVMIQDHVLLVITPQNQALLRQLQQDTLNRPATHYQQFFEGSSSTRAHYEGTKHRVPENLFGVEQMVMKLELALLKEDSTKWIGVWGKGGAGKTLISQLANNSDNVQAHFEGRIYWLTVGQNPVVANLLGFLSIQMHCPWVSGFEQQLVARNIVYNHCRDRKVLLILDDVWVPAAAEVLKQLDVVDASTGSKILVTTRNREMFDRLRPCTLLEVDMLSPENSWDLFRSHAFPDGESTLEPQVAEVAREVAAECKGLPLLLKVIGSTMAGKLHLQQWKETLKNLKEARVVNREHETEVIRKLKLSYDELLSVGEEKGKKLQTAFLYFAAFESEDVLAQWLFRLWRGEGLIVSSEDDDEWHDYDEDYYDQAGYEILEELEKRSLIERVSHWCKIHDVLRNMAIYILEKQHGTCPFKAEQGLTGWPVDSGLINVERVSLARNELEELSRPLKAPMLKVLLLNMNEKLTRIRSVFLSELKNLRVLDLSRTGIVTLPKAVSKLVNLVVLDLSHCGSLTTIPKGIGKLVKLEYLNMDWSYKLESFPFDQLANLVQLRYLGMCSCSPRKQLVSRKQVVESLLRTLYINCHHFLAAFSSFRMEKLRHLTLFSRAFQTTELNCCDGLPTSLSNLETLVCIDLRRFPRNMEKLKALTTLDLRWTWKAVGKLNTDVDSLPEEWGEPDAFPCLTRLHLSWCDSLERFPELQHGAMRRLEQIECRGCHNLKRVPESINVLTSLKRLDFGQCSNVKEIPDTLLSLDNLEDLILDHTGITTLPAGIARLPRLKKLVLHNCKHLEMLPAEWEDGEDLFPSLKSVCLSRSGVRKLPRGIATAPELQMIVVTDCKQELYEPELLSVLENRKCVRIYGWPNVAAAVWYGLRNSGCFCSQLFKSAMVNLCDASAS